jgi:hypothetical protein
MRVPLGILAFGLLATTFSTARGLDPENFVKYALEDNKVQVWASSLASLDLSVPRGPSCSPWFSFISIPLAQIFSKSYCPYCKNSKQLLDGIGVHYHAGKKHDPWPESSWLGRVYPEISSCRPSPQTSSTSFTKAPRFRRNCSSSRANAR